MAGIAYNQPGNVEAYQRIKELDVLWITAGLGCDGDTIAMTAATQPSIEDIVLGAFRDPKSEAAQSFPRIRKRR